MLASFRLAAIPGTAGTQAPAGQLIYAMTPVGSRKFLAQ